MPTNTHRNIKNVTHDLKPLLYNIESLLNIPIRSSTDMIKFKKELGKEVFLLKKYLQLLDHEAEIHGIEKSNINNNFTHMGISS